MNEQEEFWAGEFGTTYGLRNGDDLLPAKKAFFVKVLQQPLLRGEINGIKGVIEFGANRGLNLVALSEILEDRYLTAVEINEDAATAIHERMNGATWPHLVHIWRRSILDEGAPWPVHDLSISMGLLIHIAPEHLPYAYLQLYRSSRRFILIAEYFNPIPVAIEYRGHKDRLWKRDFAGETLDRFPDLKVVDYGFVWRRDPIAPLDDIHWWLLRKEEAAKL